MPPESSLPPANSHPPHPPRRMGVLGCVGIFLVIALACSLLFNLVFLGGSITTLAAVDADGDMPEVMLERAADSSAKIAHLDLDGMITSLSNGYGGIPRLTKELRHAAADEDVKAIVLRINSPGGEVTASDNLYHEVKKVNAIKPVVVYMDSVAASGGYYIACGARKIVASHTTLTGSIGVIMRSVNYRALFEKVGLEAMTFKSGQFKDTLSGSREMREDEKAYIQSLVMEMYERFVGIVADARELDVDALKSGVADGRVVTGEEALRAGLVDGTGFLEDAYALAMSEAGITDASIVTYRQPFRLGNLAWLLGEAGANSRGNRKQKLEIDLSERLVPRLQPGVLYFLMPPLAGDGGAGDTR